MLQELLNIEQFFHWKFNKIKTSKVKTFQNRTKSAQISNPQVTRYSAKVSQNEVKEGMYEISITWFVYKPCRHKQTFKYKISPFYLHQFELEVCEEGYFRTQ